MLNYIILVVQSQRVFVKHQALRTMSRRLFANCQHSNRFLSVTVNSTERCRKKGKLSNSLDSNQTKNRTNVAISSNENSNLAIVLRTQSGFLKNDITHAPRR